MKKRRFKGIDPTEKEESRKKLSNHVLNRILSMAKTISKDTLLMGKDLVKRAVSYILSQWDLLRNFLFDGNAEISNNLCEQRMKPIKLKSPPDDIGKRDLLPDRWMPVC